MESSSSLSFSRLEQPQFLQPIFMGEVLQPLDHLLGPPLDPLWELHTFPVLGALDSDTVLQMGLHKGRIERDSHLPVLAVHPSSRGTQDTLGLSGCKHTLLPHVGGVLIDKKLKSFLTELLSRSSCPSSYTYLRSPQPRCKTLHYVLLNLIRFRSTHILSL